MAQEAADNLTKPRNKEISKTSMHSRQQQNPQGYSNEPSIESKEEAVTLQIRTTA